MPPKKVPDFVSLFAMHLQPPHTTFYFLQGKSSKSKKLNETDEERAARLETEAAVAREGARRREEAAR